MEKFRNGRKIPVDNQNFDADIIRTNGNSVFTGIFDSKF